MLLKTKIIATNRTVEHKVQQAVLPTLSGEIGILPNMISTIAGLEIDELKVRRPDDETHVDYIAVNGGIIEIKDSLVTIVADSAERNRDIDVSRAERAKIRAEKALEVAKAEKKSDEINRAEVALHRALNRLNVSSHR